MLILALILTGCANDKTMIRAAQQKIVKTGDGGQNELEKAFHTLDPHFYAFCHLVDSYAKLIKKLSALDETKKRRFLSVVEENALMGLDLTYQGLKTSYQKQWEDIEANPDEVRIRSEKILSDVLKNTIDIKMAVKFVEKILSQINLQKIKII